MQEVVVGVVASLSGWIISSRGYFVLFTSREECRRTRLSYVRAARTTAFKYMR
jgi:hypothetical protein